MASEQEPAAADSALDHARRRRREQLATLADLAARAAALQPDADAAVAACGTSDVVPDAAALELGRLSRAFSPLYEQARHLEIDPDLLDARGELVRILAYHQLMLRDAGDLVFSGRTDERTARFRRELAEGLGPYARRLPDLAADLSRLLAAPADRDLALETPGGFSAGEYVLDDVDLATGEQRDIGP